jgi:UDP-glucose 4-epimerase
MNWSGKRALVTGCAGFIGSQLSERLLAEGAEVVGVDSLNDYYEVETKKLNVAGLLDHDNFTLIKEEIEKIDILPLIESSEVIFHLAAQPGVRASWGGMFDKYLGRNLLATQKILEALRQLSSGVRRRLVFASSSSVYGDALAMPTPESTERRPVSPYGMTKSACEDMIRVYGQYFGVEAVMLRYFTVYGPRQRPDMAFHRLLTAALNGRTFTVFGDGTQTRDVTYVSDVVDATVASATADGAAGEAFNVGGGRTAKLGDFLDHAATFASKGFRVEYTAAEAGDAKATSASTTGTSPIALTSIVS